MRSIDKIKTAKFGYIGISSLFCLLGIAMILFPDLSALAVEKILGVGMIIFGLIKLIGYFSKDLYRLAFQFDLAFGILLMLLGILTLVANGGTVMFICIVFGIAIMADGLFKIQIAEDSRKFGISNWWLIMALAIIACAAGIVLVLRPSIGSELLMIIFGISLLLEGILNLIVAVFAVKVTKEIHRDVIDMV
ncbi:MAG: DUF308 domain-containing protein [Clostridia bacterium]|nr:DUF308 domain-containing protein [Clostridia bacterium]